MCFVDVFNFRRHALDGCVRNFAKIRERASVKNLNCGMSRGISGDIEEVAVTGKRETSPGGRNRVDAIKRGIQQENLGAAVGDELDSKSATVVIRGGQRGRSVTQRERSNKYSAVRVENDKVA